MAKRVDPTVLDAALNLVKSGAVRMTVCSAEPTSYAGIAAVKLAEITTTSADYTVGAGTGQGRRLTTALKENAPITVTGNGTHVALHNNSSVLYYVTTCPLQALTSGGTVNIPSWTVDIGPPT